MFTVWDRCRCGPALHSSGLAKAGVAKCIGMDINKAMLKYARWKHEQQAAGVKEKKTSKGFAKPSDPSKEVPAHGHLELVNGDMTEFELEVRALTRFSLANLCSDAE